MAAAAWLMRCLDFKYLTFERGERTCSTTTQRIRQNDACWPLVEERTGRSRVVATIPLAGGDLHAGQPAQPAASAGYNSNKWYPCSVFLGQERVVVGRGCAFINCAIDPQTPLGTDAGNPADALINEYPFEVPCCIHSHVPDRSAGAVAGRWCPSSPGRLAASDCQVAWPASPIPAVASVLTSLPRVRRC